MNKKLLFLLLLSIGFGASKTTAQGTSGRDFWVAYMAHSWDCYYNYNYYWNNRDTVELFLSSQYAAKVFVEAKEQGFYDTVDLVPNVTTRVQLPKTVTCRYSDSVTTNGVHVYSSDIINVYAVNRFWFSKGATVVIPTESIVQSPEYVITTAKDNYSWGWYCNNKRFQSAEFVIVGVADSSVIEIVPTGASTRNTIANQPFQITLKKGQTFQYMTTDQDLTGSIIRSKYPMSKYVVFAGNRLTFTYDPLLGQNSCWSSWDHVYEQMTPTVAWGQNYTSMPYKENKGGYFLKVVAAENQTQVKINGVLYANLSQAEHFVYNVESDTTVIITANRRISVAQFAKGYYCAKRPSKPWLGDPSMVMLFPNEQFGKSATINTVEETSWWWYNWWWWNNVSPEHYVNVMMKTTDTSTFQINSIKVDNGIWKNIPGLNNYSYGTVKIDSGSNHLASNKGFLAYAYGYGYFEGYSYAAAANFSAIQNNFLIVNAQCVRDTVHFKAITNDSFGNYKWDFGDGSAFVNGPNVSHKYADTGWYQVSMFTTQNRTGVIDTVMKELYIADTKIQNFFPDDSLICGKLDMVIVTKGFNLDNTYLWSNGHLNYYMAIKQPGLYWLQVTERNGCTFQDTLNVINRPLPNANFTVSKDKFCLNQSKEVIFSNYSTSKDTIVTAFWDFGEGYISTLNEEITYQYKKSNTYPVILTVITNWGCRHDTFMIVDVLPSPEPQFEYTLDSCFKTNNITFVNNTVVDTDEHLRYKWYFSEGYNLSNSNPSSPRKYTDTGRYFVDLIYVNKNGCIDTARKYVHIYPHPKADFDFNTTSFCLRDSIRFDNNSFSAYPVNPSEWDFGDQNTSSAEDPSHRYLQKGNYQVKLKTTSVKGCSDSIYKVVNIYDPPKANFEISDTLQCFVYHEFTFINNSSADSGQLSNNKWKYSDGNSFSGVNPGVVTFQNSGRYRIELIVQDDFGCQDTLSKWVELKNGPQINFLINDPSQCVDNQDFILTYLPEISNDSISELEWQVNGNTYPNQFILNNLVLPVNPEMPVRLIAVSKYGCPGEKLKNIHINPKPKADFNLTDTSQCLNGNSFIPVNSSSISSGGIQSYLWNLANGNTSTLENPVAVTFTNEGIYGFELYVVSDSGCTDDIKRNVQVLSSPLVDIKPVESVCLGDTSVFINLSSISNGSITGYQWDLGDNTQSLENDPKHVYSRPGVYTIRLQATSDLGCIETAEFSNWATVLILPDARFTYTLEQGNLNNTLVTFKNTTTAQLSKFNWNFGKFGQNFNTQPVLDIVDTAGFLSELFVTDVNGCKGYISDYLFIAAPAVMYFPTAFSPNDDGVNDGFGPGGILVTTEFEMTIFNRWGEIIFRTNTSTEQWDGTYLKQHSPDGVYSYQIKVKDFYGNRKYYHGTFTLIR